MSGPRSIRFLLILCTTFILHGCLSTYSLVEFEELEPASLIFPENVSQPLVLNRLPDSRFLFDEEETEKLSGEQLMILDTLVSNNVFRGLYSILRDSPIQHFYWPVWSKEHQPALLLNNDFLLTKKEVSDLCRENNSDVIFSLEGFYLDIDNTNHTLLSRTNSFYNLQLISKSEWNVYLPQAPKPYNEFEVIDTMKYWLSTDIRNRKPFPSSKMIRKASYRSGARYGRHITPVWKRASRNMYTGQHSSLRKGSRYTDKGDWEQAYKLWSELSLKGNMKSKAKAYYNMAVYYELEDKLDTASFLVDSALICKPLELIETYRKDLDKRMQKKTTITKQVER